MISGTRTDLAIENDIKSTNILYEKENIKVYDIKNKKNIYHLIYYNDLLDKLNIKKCLIKEIKYFINKFNIKNNYHVFIVGLGNINNTADSIGPKVIKSIKVNSHLESLGIKQKIKVSALEPGVLGQTGIETKKIIESVCKSINPDMIIAIDSYVTKNLNYLNKSIQITNEGIIPGSGLNSRKDEISYQTFGIPVLVIGVPTAIEISDKNNNVPFIVATKDIDYYVDEISFIISDSLNKIFTSH